MPDLQVRIVLIVEFWVVIEAKKQNAAGNRRYLWPVRADAHAFFLCTAVLFRREGRASHDGFGPHGVRNEPNVFDMPHLVATSLPSGMNIVFKPLYIRDISAD